jgi:hypothetical protein
MWHYPGFYLLPPPRSEDSRRPVKLRLKSSFKARHSKLASRVWILALEDV